MSLPLALDMPLYSGASCVDIPLYRPLVNVHSVGDLAVRQAVNHAAFECFPVPCIVAPFVNTVGDLRVGGHKGHSLPIALVAYHFLASLLALV